METKLTYDTLPGDIKEMLFKFHTHAELVKGEEIVYRESDVIAIISVFVDRIRKLESESEMNIK
jgi:hypothetical protein